jgi:CMP-N,N'-diacetyllegionaminic acid synthase
MREKVTAVIVARAGSRRVPMKALQHFAGGRSLVAHKAWQMSMCRMVDTVVIGSDSDAIMAEGKPYGAVPVRRDAHYCDEDHCSANEMLLDMASRVPGDVILWAHPTNPLVRPETYDAAVEDFLAALHAGTHDSLLSVFPARRHAWLDGEPINYDPYQDRHTLAKDCRPVMFQDGAIFIQRRGDMIRNRYFFGARPVLFETPAAQVADIDTHADLEAARAAWGAA